LQPPLFCASKINILLIFHALAVIEKEPHPINNPRLDPTRPIAEDEVQAFLWTHNLEKKQAE
jgi:hypothetical protein